MQEIVINRCPRGTVLSSAGIAEYIARKYGGTPPADFNSDAIPRDDPTLVQLMRENVDLYSGLCSHIKIVELPDGFVWHMENLGNVEWIAPGA